MLRRASLFLISLCAAGCNVSEPASNDPAEIARAARAAKPSQAAPTTQTPSQNSKVEFLYFTATWCGPCKQVKPLFYQCMPEFPEVKFRELDVDKPENAQLASKYKVTAIPAFFVVIDGRKVASNIGAFASKEQMAKFLRPHAPHAAE